jgi:addiction module HigA family antidote
MIFSFISKETENIWQGERVRGWGSYSNGQMEMHPKRKLLTITEMNELKNIHPGEVLMEEFLIPLEITAYRLSKDIGIPQTRISEILKGKRRITADTALRLSQYFGNSAKFWLGMQDDYDIEEGMRIKKAEINSIVRYAIPKVPCLAGVPSSTPGGAEPQHG